MKHSTIILKTGIPIAMYVLLVTSSSLFGFMFFMGMSFGGSLFYALTFPTIFYLFLSPYSGRVFINETEIKVVYFNLISAKSIIYTEYLSVSYHEGEYNLSDRYGLSRLRHSYLLFKGNNVEAVIYVELNLLDQEKVVKLLNDQIKLAKVVNRNS